MSDTGVPEQALLQQEVAAQAKDLLQEQLTNLSARLFEVGKRADQQLTTWVAFAALCPLVLFGASDDTSVGDVKLDPLVAGAAIYVVSCVFYYRAILSIGALGHWRSFLKKHRRERFAVFYQVARNSQVGEEQIERELDTCVSEYPGYVACSALVKEEALGKGALSGKYISAVHKLIIFGFVISPYALAASLLYATWFSWWYIGAAALGLIITLSGNVVLGQGDDA
jgi:hypothetical protein